LIYKAFLAFQPFQLPASSLQFEGSRPCPCLALALPLPTGFRQKAEGFRQKAKSRRQRAEGKKKKSCRKLKKRFDILKRPAILASLTSASD